MEGSLQLAFQFERVVSVAMDRDRVLTLRIDGLLRRAVIDDIRERRFKSDWECFDEGRPAGRISNS